MKISGGNAAIYYAHNLVKFISGEKYNVEDNGFDGFLVKAEFLKSRTNKAGGSFCNLVYNQSSGFDPVLTLFTFAEDRGLVTGRNPKRTFEGYPDIKFDARKFREEYNNNPEIKNILFTVTKPHLEALLSTPEEREKNELTHDEVLHNLILSQEEEVFDTEPQPSK